MSGGAGDDFYVGYLKSAPPALARWVRAVAIGLVVAATLVALVLVNLQGRFDPGVFEFGVEREFSGVLVESPYPMLLVDAPGARVPGSAYLLVAFGKHGAAPAVAGLDGRQVRLRGSLIYNQGLTMIELVDGSVETLATAATPPPAELELGSFTLAGEIVDSKCYLGVMKPGREKPHRACAELCIRGGIPPLFRVETDGGEVVQLLLVDVAGEPVNERVLDLVAEPVEITGRVTRAGDRLVLAADPELYRRL